MKRVLQTFFPHKLCIDMGVLYNLMDLLFHDNLIPSCSDFHIIYAYSALVSGESFYLKKKMSGEPLWEAYNHSTA